MSDPNAPLAGKVALITGGSKGIGRATALRLARDGAKVVINYSSDETAAEEAIKAIGSEKAFAVKADAGDIDSISNLVNATVEKYGRLDIVVANAGILKLDELDKVTEADFDKVFKINVKGPLFLAQKAAPHLKPGSSVIFFSSTQATASTVTPNYLVYCASKGAIEQITRLVAKDLGRKGVLVNCISPGPTSTELFLQGKSDGLIKTIASFNPQNKLGKPEDIADTVAFLASTGWVSGQTLRVNGGQA